MAEHDVDDVDLLEAVELPDAVAPAGERGCTYRMPGGRVCGATRQRHTPYCRLHDPDPDAQARAAEGRRLAGLRRRRERTLAEGYGVTGVRSRAELKHVLDRAMFDAFSVADPAVRVRLLLAVLDRAGPILERDELEARVAALEASRKPHAEPTADGGLLAEAQRLGGVP